jgi:CBS domain-containing protein
VEEILNTGFRRLPVITKKKELVGVLTITDILDAFLRREEFDKKISTIMNREPVFCNVDDTIGFVLQKFKLSKKGGFPVLKNKKLVGMVSERDIVKYFSDVKFGIKIKDVMTPRPFFIKPNITVFNCLKTMVNVRYRRLPVVQNKKLIGIVTSIDFLRYIKYHDYDFDKLGEEISTIIIRSVIKTTPSKDVSEAIRLMKTRDIGGILIVDRNNNLEGIITERDILSEIV